LDAEFEETLRSLGENNFDVRFAENKSTVREIVLGAVSKGMIVGIGDSATVRQIEIEDNLKKRSIRVLNPFTKELTRDSSQTVKRDNISRKIFLADVLLVGTNAVTKDGKLVNIDAVGNRVASMIFGPRKVFVIAGKNKIVKNVDEAMHTIKNVIAPFHAKTKRFPTPCAQTGKCSDCKAPKRICSVTTILEKKPWRTDVTVILVNEDLGLGWSETWPKQRIGKIKAAYEKVTWVFASAKVS